MPWEVSSLLSRLRVRTTSHSTYELPFTTAPSATSATPLSEQHTEVAPVRKLPNNLKILQDPSSYIDTGEEHSFPRGLTPSTRRHSMEGSNTGTIHLRGRRPRLVSERISEADEPGASLTDGQPVKQSGFVKRLSKVAAGGEWSTFGRSRGRQTPDAFDFHGRHSLDDTHRGISSSPSPRRINRRNQGPDTTTSIHSNDTLGRLTNPSRPSLKARSSSSSTKSPMTTHNNHSGSDHSSPMSSRRHPRTPRGPCSNTCPIPDHAMSLVTHSTTSVAQAVYGDSPHTFGHPTPPDIRPDSSFTFPSPPPPLPPLDHPELAAVLSSRSKSTATKQPSLPTLSDQPNTLPRTLSGIGLVSRSSTAFGRSIHHRSSFPRAQQNLNTSMEAQHEEPPPRRPRARSVSERTQRLRRTSADWSAYQAIAGVNAASNQAWPAEVSREILRLSLGAELDEYRYGGASSPRRASGSSIPRGSSMYGLPDRATTVSPFLPFPPPSRQSYPAPLKGPMTLLDGREPTFSHQNDAESWRDSRQAARTMAGVKRSLSAVEARNGRKHEATTNPSTDPGDAMAKRGPTPRSLHSINAPPPSSRTLLSGRYTPRTSLPHFVDEVPSTPTPVSRHLSDKGKGKRKAEDLDVTPPEQKKEGQRATFVLPSENRSQRISGSSHAPSSYHRKRARLSSTSPLTTPAQSRPASVQEPPSHFASWSSNTAARVAPPSRTPSRAASTRSQLPQNSHRNNHERHQSMSQISIPISALVSPHAPSVSKSTKFHMRDPRKPPKKLNDTEWGLRFATEDEPGSPLQAWCFFVGFLLFPVWWVAALLRTPRTRMVGDTTVEKAVTIDDPQIEHDAQTWRFRCRVMAVVSIFTYIPFIILVAVFVPR